MVVNMEIGMITPPVGLNLFVASAITGLTLPQVISGTALVNANAGVLTGPLPTFRQSPWHYRTGLQ